MTIAILGWGSLVWDPRNLEIDKTIGQNGWFDDGPMLPIEFARISKGPRLTLVIRPESELVQILYAISNYENLEEAISSLREREGCNKQSIGVYDKNEISFSNSEFLFKSNIELWIEEKEEIDAAIWTNLSENFQEKTQLPFNEKNVFNYLNNLVSQEQTNAKEYICKAPAIIDTPVRRAIEISLGWKKIENNQ